MTLKSTDLRKFIKEYPMTDIYLGVDPSYAGDAGMALLADDGKTYLAFTLPPLKDKPATTKRAKVSYTDFEKGGFIADAIARTMREFHQQYTEIYKQSAPRLHIAIEQMWQGANNAQTARKLNIVCGMIAQGLRGIVGDGNNTTFELACIESVLSSVWRAELRIGGAMRRDPAKEKGVEKARLVFGESVDGLKVDAVEALLIAYWLQQKESGE